MSTTREWDLKRYCKEYQKIENYEKAISSPEIYDLHHRLEFAPFSGKQISAKRLKELGLYYNQEPEAFIFLSHSEHTTLHQLGKDRSNVSEETKRKISKSVKKIYEERGTEFISDATKAGMTEEVRKKISDSKRGKKSSWKGKHPTDDSRKKMSESHKGKHWKLVDGKRVWY